MIKKESIEELIKITDREVEKLKIVMDEVGKEIPKEVKTLIESYIYDLNYFYNKKDYVKAFELANYIWGYLDCLANLKLINPSRVPTIKAYRNKQILKLHI